MTDKLTPEQTAAHHYASAYRYDPRNIETIAAAAFYAGIEFAKAQAAGGTPAADWRERGETDPHDHDMYKGERSLLCLGSLTDDALANAVFMHYNDFPSPLALMSGEAKMPIIYVTAAKERIRWLSRKLQASLEKEVRYQELCSAAYQMAGVVDAPERFLDALSNAADGNVLDNPIDLLPVGEDEFKFIEAEPEMSGLGSTDEN